jgi:hypothetical protein
MERKSNRERFIQLCEKRVNKAIKNIRLIGNLSNKTNYKYDESDVRKIVRTLQNELNNLKGRFDTKDGDSGIDFKL